jgi:hypothetical protein
MVTVPGVRPDIHRVIRAGRALAERLERGVTAAQRAGLTPQQQRLWRVNIHRRSSRLQEWASYVEKQVGPRVEELSIRELDFLSNTLGRASRALERAGRGTPVSIRRVQRLIAPRLRLPML